MQKASGKKSRCRRNDRFGAEDFVAIERFIRFNLSPEHIIGRKARMWKIASSSVAGLKIPIRYAGSCQ